MTLLTQQESGGNPPQKTGESTKSHDHGNTLGALAAGNIPGRRDIYTPLFYPSAAARVKPQAFENGLLVLGLSGTVDGNEGESIMLAPAYTNTEGQASDIVRLLVKSISEVSERF